MTLQTPFDLGCEVCGEAQLLQSLLQDLGGVLRLVAVALQTLLGFEVATLSGFGVFFDGSCGGGHGSLLDAM